MAYFYKDGQNINTSTHRANGVANAENEFNPQGSSSNSLLQSSTNIFIYANGGPVGMIQSFRISENRTINKLQSVGYEGVVQAVPSNTNGGQLEVSRIALYNSNLWHALGLTMDGAPVNDKVAKKYHNTEFTDVIHNQVNNNNDDASVQTPFVTLRDQRVPLEIQVKTPMKGDRSKNYVETYVDCWLSSYSKSYSVGTITVAENATISYADVY